MKIYTHNFNPQSNSGPNKFTRQLFTKMLRAEMAGIVDSQQVADIEFCLIQQAANKIKPMVLRLDGIYFNSEQDYEKQNTPIKLTYDNSDAVIFQSQFNKELTEHWFGPHKNSHIIHNAADLELINSILINDIYDKINWPWSEDKEVWSCASSWRPHKRLSENIKCFLEKAPKDAVFAIAGKGVTSDDVRFSSDERIYFLGELQYQQLLCLYRRSSTFIHLAYLDHCPNVVVDAQASGCKIICSSTGGTKEIVNYGIIVKEEEWDFSPIKLYQPPALDLDSNIIVNNKIEDNNMTSCVKKYYSVMKEIL